MLVNDVAREIALSQTATAAVDEAAAAILGLNPTDLRALGRLHAAGPMTAGQLARHVGLSKGAMTAALDRLERSGYVGRERRDEDRRLVTVEVTDHARELMNEIWGPLGSEGVEQLRGFTSDQLELLLDFLRRSRELQERHAGRIRAMVRAGKTYPEGREA